LLAWSVAAFAAAPSVACILLAVPEAQVSRAVELYGQRSQEQIVVVLPGGSRKRDGVEAALRALPDNCAFVAIHDATRPLVTATLIEAGAALVREASAAIPVEEVKETIKRVRDGVIVGAIARERLTRAQTPQFFSRTLLQEAYQRAASELDPPDEAALLLAAGLPLNCYAGDAENLRVTSVDETPVVEKLLRRRNG
jgi:2-C-methyl-D-erythritol 4-phosphate cytidylyltransferase